jgi:hypothetical protein
MVKQNRSKNSSTSLTQNAPDTLKQKKSTTRRSRKGAKPKRAGKGRSNAKRASNKKTSGKGTKRTGRKRGGRKGARHAEHSQTQVHEAAANSE